MAGISPTVSDSPFPDWRAVPAVAIHTMIADAGYESKGLFLDLKDQNGWKLTIVKRKEQAFKIAGLNWIVERSFAWLGRQRRMSKDYEYRVQTSETLIRIAACALMVRRIAP